MRCFIAIELDDHIRENLGALRKELQSRLWGFDKGLKWVRAENLHLTVKFLGDVEDKMIMDVCRACDRAAAEHASFDFELGTVGTFPSGGSARVIWAGISQGLAELQALYGSVEKHMANLRFNAEERKFSPHTTLARIKLAETGRNAAEIVKNLSVLPFGTQGVESLTIFQSSLEEEGSTYSVIHRSALK